MTIDKAIAQEKELFEHCKRLYEPLNDEDRSINPLLKNEMEYHKQRAEWLEELKDYRDKNKLCIMVDAENLDRMKDKFVEIAKEYYNNAIDDFISLIESKRCIRYTREYVIELAEQLKVGVSNDNG